MRHFWQKLHLVENKQALYFNRIPIKFTVQVIISVAHFVLLIISMKIVIENSMAKIGNYGMYN